MRMRNDNILIQLVTRDTTEGGLHLPSTLVRGEDLVEAVVLAMPEVPVENFESKIRDIDVGDRVMVKELHHAYPLKNAENQYVVPEDDIVSVL